MLPRPAALRALADEAFDVLVVGGGITGAGVALDAATRGYSVALVERADYAAGTSSRSSKLVHGGLRYLRSFDLGLVREALLERQVNAALAPHLVRPLPLLVPAFDGRRPDRLTGIGLNLYDVMAVDHLRRAPRGRRRVRGEAEGEWSPDRHRVVDGAEVVARIPALAGRRPSGGYLFYDCQADDVRLVLTVLGEAERFGAIFANGLEATGLLEAGGRARGAHVRDAATGDAFAVRAATVVNATGVWADRLRPGELRDEAEVPSIRPSRGTHVVVDSRALALGGTGAIAPAGDGRTIFVLPWLGQTLVGTTDADYAGDLDHVAPAADDVAYLLEATGRFFDRRLEEADLAGAFAGVRPLIASGDPRRSVDISRKAELYETSSGMVTITGGKLTTWRRMAKAAVDSIAERDGRDAPCRTDEVPLGMPVDPAELTRLPGVAEATYGHLADRYGVSAHAVLAVAAERPELAAPIVEGRPDLVAEAAFAARREQAGSVGAVLLRRTRLGLLAARELAPGSPGARRVAEALGREHGWSAERVDRELGAWEREAAREGILPTA